jgi:hypothetical protein
LPRGIKGFHPKELCGKPALREPRPGSAVQLLALRNYRRNNRLAPRLVGRRAGECGGISIPRLQDTRSKIMDEISKYLPLLIPLTIIQFGLMVLALVDLLRREKPRGPKWIWVLIIIFVNIFGPIIYFVIGREEE